MNATARAIREAIEDEARGAAWRPNPFPSRNSARTAWARQYAAWRNERRDLRVGLETRKSVPLRAYLESERADYRRNAARDFAQYARGETISGYPQLSADDIAWMAKLERRVQRAKS